MDLIFTNDADEAEVVTFDATLRETHSAGATVTEHAVETGADVADHVRPSVRKATFEVFVSDSPAEEPATLMYGTRGRATSVDLRAGRERRMKRGASGYGTKAAEYTTETLKASANVLQFDGPFARRERVYEKLEQIRTEKRACIAICELAELDDVVITSLSAPLDSKSGDGIVFTLELTQIRFATSQIVEVPDPESPRERPTTDGGSVTPVALPPESLLYQQTARLLGLRK